MNQKPIESNAAWTRLPEQPEAAMLRRKRLELEEAREAEAARDGHGCDSWSVFSAPWLLDKALTLTGLRRAGERNANAPVLRRITARYPDLPASLDGFRIVQLSDFHFDYRAGFVEAATSVVRGLECDLCVVTGDFRFCNTGPAIHLVEGTQAILSGVHARLGCYAVLGNHDRLEFVDKLEQVGLRVLVNEGEALTIGATCLWLAGTDDPHYYRCHSLELALRGAPEHAFILALIHSPEVVREAARRGVQLYLCGHTHGGQVCLPGRIPLLVNARCRLRYCSGPWTYRKMLGYTTTGLGTTDLPVRFFCPPEVVILTLRRGEFGIEVTDTSQPAT